MQTNKIILGTVQLGLPYGINNKKGQPSVAEAHAILELAFQKGVRTLDTAEAYGTSQTIIGLFHQQNPDSLFKVMTKFKKSADLEKNLEKSLKELKASKVFCYSYHDMRDAQDTELAQALKKLKVEGKIEQIGISIYTNEEFLKAIETPDIDVIQIPFNLLDNWRRKGELIKLASSNGKRVHVRSVFLQGLFFMKPEKLPQTHKGLAEPCTALRGIAEDLNLNLGQLALAYALSFEDIDKVLIGVEAPEQLSELLSVQEITLHKDVLERIENIPLSHEGILDPRTWK